MKTVYCEMLKNVKQQEFVYRANWVNYGTLLSGKLIRTFEKNPFSVYFWLHLIILVTMIFRIFTQEFN